ncbi:hypothetical protein GLOIN_2v1769198 [Rhizophagus irregularis DAOM 181602=DAOM 197198]|uniref:Kelch-like protein 17 n=2 Tax=Rhizophagus irregularis TaxID=588596 RepID=A0A015M4L9_RHIIW|nr:hypothetical protein GLOIN_2v1769198 [Rhizophagus irregularis DAOM 181602=DAOM 197198]EXX79956.1 hypothetical protein RirG_000620 [Rhizophagus irregularis DAOM 197198w]POG76183.1 hypothetical protein GLOIN_2v1769198 [Rhizophagus irregularis DAOM 181602=DAOM 197198]|eukprot:XP_025183049.1 hypothetical protein GLOIN_2v1769198 [Rhizophagus irregularis DAOM 181602=DAOM 197198]
MSYKFESDAIKAFEQLLLTEIDYNVIINIGEKPNFREFHAHSNILRCRSHHFNKILSVKNIEKKDEKYVIKYPNISPKAFSVIIKYLYTGHINVDDKTGTELLDIMIASDELKLEQLTKLAEDFILENHHQFLRSDPVGTLQIVYYNKSLVNLQEFCLETICFEPKILFNSDKFINLPAPLLEIILKRDDLNLPEIEVWENLIKWGLAQGQTPNQHVSKWSKEYFNHFQRILYKFIPLIRFYEISSDDYFNKVKSYEEILPKELRDDILKFHMVTEYKPTLDKSSQRCPKYSLINQNHIVVFSNWIDKKGKITKYTSKTIPYELNLLYRASRDGGTPEAFHKKCDNKGATIIIIKIKDSEKIIGGYNPFDWDSSNSYKSTTDSFIFSFTDRMNIKTGKLGYSNGTKSIGCYPDYGPVFGGFFYCIDHNTWTINNSDTYTNIDGIPTGNLKTDDYEVFQIVKKKVTKNTLKKKTEIQKNDPDLDDEGNLKADKISEEDREREEKKSSSIISLFKKTK